MTDMSEYMAQAGDDAELSADATAAIAYDSQPDETPIPDASPEETEKLRAALGGISNIVSARPAAKTRLLVTVKDVKQVKPETLREDNISIFIPDKGNEIHVLPGVHPERFRSLLDKKVG